MGTTIRVVNGTTFTRTYAESTVRTNDNKSQRHDEIQTLCRQLTRVTKEQHTPIFAGDRVQMNVGDKATTPSVQEDNMVKMLRKMLHEALKS